MKIIIDGELEDVTRIVTGSYLPIVEIGRRDYYVAEDEERAGVAAARYWRDMAEGDPREFVAIIGEDRLVGWAIGQSDIFGISGLEDFLERVASVPEEEFASYDGNSLECTTDASDFQPLLDQIDEWEKLTEIEFRWPDDREKPEMLETENEAANDLLAEIDGILDELKETEDELGFIPSVAYRHN